MATRLDNDDETSFGQRQSHRLKGLNQNFVTRRRKNKSGQKHHLDEKKVSQNKSIKSEIHADRCRGF